jgi:hypothetical protein
MANFSYQDFTKLSERNYITNELSDMLSQLCQEKNLSFALTKTRYTHEALKITVEISPKAEGDQNSAMFDASTLNDPDLGYRNAWKRQANRYRSLGLQNDWLGKKIKFGRNEYTIVGLAQRKQRCPIIIRFGTLVRKISVASAVERNNNGGIK